MGGTDHKGLIRSTDLALLLNEIRALPDGLEKQFVELLDVLRCSHEHIEKLEALIAEAADLFESVQTGWPRVYGLHVAVISDWLERAKKSK